MKKIENILIELINISSNNPNQIVFEHNDKSYTYSELITEAKKVASYILNNFDQNKKPIIVYGNQSFEMLYSMVGCSLAGRPYIPIDEHTPTERLQMIIDVANPELVICSDKKDENINNVSFVSIHDMPNDILSNYPLVGLDDVYYIIFTSGTTGVPKGVQITHRNLLSFVNWELADFNLPEHSRFLLQAPFSFDLSVMSLYPALMLEGTLIPLTKEVINDFQKLFEVLPKLNLNVWVSTPSFMDICLMQPDFNEEKLSTISHFLFCGEELLHKTAQKLRERFNNSHIFNTYGPTEATVAISEIDITSEVLQEYNRLPIGYIKSDTKVIIMDDDEQLSANEKGEIVIVGPSVSVGYLNNPKKTEEAFFTCDGMAAYRTGDAGHIDEKGLLHYDGRIDFQIKLHGYRMELEDIDHHLNNTKYVKQATVVPKYKDHKVQQLVAYVVPTDDYFEKDYQRTKAIKQELSETIMDYMIPNKYIYVDKLPLTNNGKIDRKGLINEVNAT